MAAAWTAELAEREQVEALLHERLRASVSLAAHAPDIISRFDRALRHLYVNPAVERATGRRAAEFLGRTNEELGMPAELCAFWNAQLERVFETAQPHAFAFAFPAPDGSRPYEARISPEFDEAGAVTSVVAVVRDMSESPPSPARETPSASERTSSEAEPPHGAPTAPAESEQRFRNAFHHAGIGMALVGLDGRFVRVNAAVCQITGYGEAELLARTFQDITHSDDLGADLAHLRRLTAGEIESYSMEKRYIRKDGRVVWILLTASCVRAPDGRPREYIAQIQDISEQKRVEAELREAQEHLTAVVATQQAIATAGLDLGRVLDLVVGRARELTGADGAVVEMLDGPETLVYRAASGVTARHVGLRLAVATSLSGRCVRSGTLLRCDDAEQDPRVDAAACRRVGARSMLVAPLLHAGRPVGALKVSSPMPSAFDSRHEATLQLLAGLVASAVDNAAQFDATQQLVSALEASEQRFESMVTQAAVGIAVFDPAGVLVEANDALARLVGEPRASLLGRGCEDFVHEGDRPAMRAHTADVLAGRVPSVQLDLALTRWDRAPLWADVTLSRMRSRDGGVTVLAMVQDATERKRLEQELTRQASRDTLTGLANRAVFNDALAEQLRPAGRRRLDGGPAVLLLDLDHFKTVNDSLGHAAGDALLLAVAARLRSATRGSDTVARLGGDEFAVLLPAAADDAEGPGAVARRILEAMQAPVVVEGREVVASVSIGLARALPGDAAGDLLRNADAALYHAKAQGRGRCEEFSAELSEQARARLDLELGLRRALERGEIDVAYQPIVELESGRVVAAEALARWRDPARGDVPPSDFIPVAEETGLIVDLGVHVLETACREAAGWAADGASAPRVSVNVSPRQLLEPTFVATVEATLRETGLPPERLMLEITEGVLLSSVPAVLERLAAVRAMGVRLALDDFGTGYSSLGYLHRFPVDLLKIDRSFVAELRRDEGESPITAAVVYLAATLGLDIVAEGIEREEQRAQLVRVGARLGQGYLFARPLDAATIRDVLGARLGVRLSAPAEQA